MPSRLWFRLLIGSCLVLAVTLGAVVLLVNKALTGRFQDYVGDQQSARVQRAESILSRYYDRSREWTGVEAPIQSIADLMGERLVLADAQGRVVADSQNRLVGQMASEDWPGRRVPIRSQEFAVGTLYINAVADGQGAAETRAQLFLATLNGYLGWAVVVGLLAALALSLGVARWLAAPLEALTQAARGIERGELEQRIDTTVGGEVGALAEAFNSLAASLARVERLRRNMVTDIAHELRTPLASVRGYLEAIQDGVVEPNAETLDTIHRELMQLTRLVDDLQELSLAEAHQLHLDRQEVDVPELVEWEVRAFRPQAVAQQVRLWLDAPEAGPPVPRLRLDGGRIAQVLGNVLRNALAHTPAGGQIRVGVTVEDEQVCIAVEDSGAGIAPEDLEHIFERFYRADKARSPRPEGGRSTRGTGLGLTIARELLRAHGGSIKAESELGRGARVMIALPIETEAEPATAPEPAATLPSVGRSRPASLIAQGAMLGALFGAAGGLIESTMASALMRRAQGFMDLSGYAVLIDGGLFAVIGAVASALGAGAARTVGYRLTIAGITAVGVPLGFVMVGLLTAYRWNQLFNKEASPDSPEVLYPVAIIVSASALLAVVASFGATAVRRRAHRRALTFGRRALPAALVGLIALAGVLVGREQAESRLAPASASAVAPTGATSPRSPDAQPAARPVLPPEAPPLASEPVASGADADRPSVLLITVSSLRADHLGAYGYEKARTPSIDRLARAGVRFETALTQQPNTNAAHAAILTGTYPATNGVRIDLVDRLNPSVPTLAQAFADQRYRTAAIYSWVSFEPAYSGLDRGFHDYLDLTINRPEYLSDNRAQALAATYQRLKAYLAVPGAVPGAVDEAFSLQGVEEALDGKADVTTEAAIAWLEENQNAPFFLWVHYFDPHYPYSPTTGFDDVEDTGCGDTCPDGTIKTTRDIEAGAQLTASQINHLVGLYDGEIAFTDQQIGRLLGRLGELGLDRNTMVVLTGDHGQSFDEHDTWFNGSGLHNAETRIPLIITMPGRVGAETVVTAPAMGIDIAPTALAAIGAPSGAGSGFEGRSLLPLMNGQPADVERAAIAELGDKSQLAVTTRGWKLIWSAEDQTSRLYYLPGDPNELNDRAQDEPEVTAELLGTLQAWRVAHPR